MCPLRSLARPASPSGLILVRTRIVESRARPLWRALTCSQPSGPRELYKIWCSRAALDAGGLTRDDVIGKPFSLIPVKDAQERIVFCCRKGAPSQRSEFRTPLTLMMGPLEEMLAERSEADPRLELAHRNSLRLLELVNTLLDFSRIEAGRIDASYEPTELSVFTAELASNFRSRSRAPAMAADIDHHLIEPMEFETRHALLSRTCPG